MRSRLSDLCRRYRRRSGKCSWLRDAIKHGWRNWLRGWSYGGGRRRTRSLATSATASTATATAAVVLVRLGSRGVGFRWRLLENRFPLTVVQIRRGLRALLFGEFRDKRLGRDGQLCHSLADRDSRRVRRCRDGSAQPSQRFFGLLLPLGPAEAFGSSSEPASRLGKRAGLFMDLRQFERDHRVASAFIQRRKLSWGIRAGSSLADTRLNLSPIAHCPILYQRGARGTKSRARKSYV